MKKQHVAAAVLSLALLILTLLPLLVFPPEHLAWWRWRLTIILAGIIAAIASFLQILWTKQDDEVERKRLYEVLQRILKTVEDRAKRRSRLSLQAATCANDLLCFLAEAGPQIRKFDPVSYRNLYNHLDRAYKIGHQRFVQDELTSPISKGAILQEIERLVTVAVEHLDENT